jgi:hypothetical protein
MQSILSYFLLEYNPICTLSSQEGKFKKTGGKRTRGGPPRRKTRANFCGRIFAGEFFARGFSLRSFSAGKMHYCSRRMKW